MYRGRDLFLRRLCVCLTLFFAIFIATYEVAESREQLFSISVLPKKLYQGEMVKVLIRPTSPEIRLLSCNFFGKEIPYVKDETSYWCLLGAGLNEKTGLRLLTLRWKKGGENGIWTVPIMVYKKDYPKEFLKVPEKMVEFPKPVLKRVLEDQRAIRTALSSISADKFFEGHFIKPVPGQMKSPFGLRRYFNKKPRNPHSGVDLSAKRGTPVLASNSGRIALVRDCYLSGKTVVIDHGLGLYSIYAHLDKTFVHTGQIVQKGEKIGLSGMTGRATGPHLHWGTSLYGMRVDPLSVLKIF